MVRISRKRRKEATNNMRALPQDLIVRDILPRLPVKSLLEWNSLISDNRDFANLQLQFQQSCPSYYLVHEYPPTRNSSNSNCRCCSSSVVSLSHRSCERSSSSGIIRRYELWNPATGGQWLIPAPPLLLDCYSRPCYNTVCEGFGYIPSIDDYKIVILRQSGYSSLEKIHHALTFSCRTNTWTQTKQRDDYNTVDSTCWRFASMQGVQVGESLHWGLSCFIYHAPIHPVVLAFNLANNSFHPIRVSLPDPSFALPSSYAVSKIRDRLCVSWPKRNHAGSYNVVCMLHDDDNYGSNWKHIFTLDPIQRYHKYNGFLENNNDDGNSTAVVLVNHEHKLVSTSTSINGKQDQTTRTSTTCVSTTRTSTTLLLELQPLVSSVDCYISTTNYIQTLVSPFTSHRRPTTVMPMVDL